MLLTENHQFGARINIRVDQHILMRSRLQFSSYKIAPFVNDLGIWGFKGVKEIFEIEIDPGLPVDLFVGHIHENGNNSMFVPYVYFELGE
jgi:hypothetical protein